MLKFCALLVSVCGLLLSFPTAGLSSQSEPGMQALLEMMVDKGMITQSEADVLLQNPQQGALSQEAPEPVKFKAPAWTERLKWSGDIRLRYEGDFFHDGNVTQGDLEHLDEETALNTEDRHRLRYRARLSLDAEVTDHWRATFRLATGNQENPISTNDTLGDDFNKDNILFDRAYLEWTPTPSFTVTGGRIPNPWFSTDLVWDRDLNFEGVAFSYHRSLRPEWALFATAGVFPLEEVEQSKGDKWLYGGQLGMQVGSPKAVSAQMGVAYYFYDNIVGEPNAIDEDPDTTAYTAPGYLQKGNTLMDINSIEGEVTPALASEFKELDLLTTVDIAFWDPIHVVFIGEYVKNLGFDRNAVSRRHGERASEEDTSYVLVPKADTAYLLGMALGHPQVNDWGEWNTFVFYKYLEADAVLDAFTSGDFRLGGTNAKGWILGTEVGVTHNVWMTAKWQTADEIDGPPLGIDVLQLDLNAKF